MTTQAQFSARMRSQAVVSILVIVALALNVQAQVGYTGPRTVTLKQGQLLEMKLVTRLDSRRAKIGDDVVLRLTKSLTADGATVLPADWVVHGHITDVKRAGRTVSSGRSTGNSDR